MRARLKEFLVREMTARGWVNAEHFVAGFTSDQDLVDLVASLLRIYPESSS